MKKDGLLNLTRNKCVDQSLDHPGRLFGACVFHAQENTKGGMRELGVEPRQFAWKANVIPLDHSRLRNKVMRVF